MVSTPSAAIALMINGVRASSIKMLSASSTMAKVRVALHGRFVPTLITIQGVKKSQALLTYLSQYQAITQEIEAKLLGGAVRDGRTRKTVAAEVGSSRS